MYLLIFQTKKMIELEKQRWTLGSTTWKTGAIQRLFIRCAPWAWRGSWEGLIVGAGQHAGHLGACSGLELIRDCCRKESAAGICGWGEILRAAVDFTVMLVCLSQAMVHSSHHCAVCMQFVRKENLLSLACQHQFCRSCWEQHCTVLVKDGVGVGKFKADLSNTDPLPSWLLCRQRSELFLSNEKMEHGMDICDKFHFNKLFYPNPSLVLAYRLESPTPA